MAAKSKQFDVSSSNPGASTGGIGKTAKGAHGDTLVASHVGEMDMVRIREAEKVIDADEVKYGKYILDEAGRVVPERVLFDHRSSMKNESLVRQREKKRRAHDKEQHLVRDPLALSCVMCHVPCSCAFSCLFIPGRCSVHAVPSRRRAAERWRPRLVRTVADQPHGHPDRRGERKGP